MATAYYDNLTYHSDGVRREHRCAVPATAFSEPDKNTQAMPVMLMTPDDVEQ
jgi:putative SOS response-associated peptidase YedK